MVKTKKKVNQCQGGQRGQRERSPRGDVQAEREIRLRAIWRTKEIAKTTETELHDFHVESGQKILRSQVEELQLNLQDAKRTLSDLRATSGSSSR